MLKNAGSTRNNSPDKIACVQGRADHGANMEPCSRRLIDKLSSPLLSMTSMMTA